MKTSDRHRRGKSANLVGLIKLKICQSRSTIFTEMEPGAIQHLCFHESAIAGDDDVTFVKKIAFF